MFILVKNKITGDYHTIYRKDKQDFLNLKSFFGTGEFNFDIIEDVNDIKKILENKFASKGRGEEYDENIPSVTKIAYSLAPLNINSDKFLIRYWNNTPLKEQEGDKEFILAKGSWCHKILELYVTDKENRSKDKPLIEKIKIIRNSKKPSKELQKQIDNKIISDIRRYIKIAYNDKEILSKIHNIDEVKEELEFLAVKCLPEFIKNELIFTDCVYSEIFLRVDNSIQGSVDLCCYSNNKFSIWDFKTANSLDKKTGKPKFKSNSVSELAPYARQLYSYDKLLKECKMSHIFSTDLPEFSVVQIHLANGKYKKFDIPKGLVEAQGKLVEKVLKWYWNIRNGIKDIYNDELEELEYITL